MRVAFDTTPLVLGGGGVATYARELLAGLGEQRDLDVIPVCHGPSAAVRGNLGRIIAGMGRELLWHPRGLDHAAKAAGADLIHTPASLPVISRAVPVVMTIHDAIPWRHPEWFTRANALQQRHLVGRAARRATRIITVSQSARRDLIETLGIQSDRIEAVYEGISPSFAPRHRDPEWLARRFAVTGPVVLSVGTPEPRKNLPSVLQAYARVVASIPSATLLLVGGHGWRNADLDTAIGRTPGRVVRTGYIDFHELTRVYASADCLLFPSLMEGFGFPPLEAMASGTPVVCSDQPSLPEIVGEAAITADPMDVDGLASGVATILTDRRIAEDMRQRGLAHAASFTWDRTVDETVRAYRRAVEG